MEKKQVLSFDSSPMVVMQYAVVFICFLMNTLDGMDVMIISYAAPAIAKAWSISPASLGIVFSAGLAGMTVGTFFIAPLADTIGRKSIILISALLMGTCIYLTSYAEGVTSLLIYRFLSGLGIGSMLASTASLTSEYTPSSSRNFWVSFVLAGYPVGAVFSGMAAANIIPNDGWEQMFRVAGLITLLALPLIYFLLAESVSFYVTRQPADALMKVNRILKRFKLSELDALPALNDGKKSKLPISEILKSTYLKPSIQLWLALFMAFGAMYYLVSWIPKLATDAGLSMDLAIYAGTVFNVGAFIGILTQGYFSSKFGLKKTIGVFLVCTGILMACFGLFVGSDWLLLVITLLGFGIQGGFVGLYAVAARLYPTAFRTTGVGWAMGAGRFGGIIGPFVGGLLMASGFTLATSFLCFAAPALAAGIITWRLKSDAIH